MPLSWTQIPPLPAGGPSSPRMAGRSRRAAAGVATFLLIALVFGTAYTFRPLYTSNQNHHFLKGLADAGLGLLGEDWQVRSVDPFPVFSALVTVTYRFLSPYAFYVWYYLLFGAYAVGTLAVARTGLAGREERAGRLLVFTVFTLLHNEAFGYLFVVDKAHIGWWQLTHWGVAGQEIFGHGAFQASSFGMLLPVAILLFLRGRPMAATLLAALVVDLHFSYALTSGALVAAFLVVTGWQRRNWRLAALMALLGAVVVSPAVAYTQVNFGASSPEVAERAFRILTDHLPFEAVPSAWFDARALVQIGLVAAAFALVRATPLGPILALPALVAIAGTAVQVATDSRLLGLVFPWRPSVLVVPLSTAILVTRGAAWLAGRGVLDRAGARRAVLAGSTALLAFLAGSGIVRMTSEFAYFYDYRPVTALLARAAPPRMVADFIDELRPDSVEMFSFVARTRAPGEVYVIPPDLQRFRLEAGAPAFVDFKSHPYKDVEVLEWRRRLTLAERFYADPGDCSALARITGAYRVTHVVLDRRKSRAACPDLVPAYVDDSYGVYRIAGPELRRGE